MVQKSSGRWQLFGCCSRSRRPRCNSDVFGSGTDPSSRARTCARGQSRCRLEQTFFSVIATSEISVMKRTMRFSRLDSAWRCLTGLLAKLMSSPTDRSFSSVPQRLELSPKQTRFETQIIRRTTSLFLMMSWDLLRWTCIAVFDFAARFDSNAVTWPSRQGTNVSKGDLRSITLPRRGLATRRRQAGAHVVSEAPGVGNVACCETDKTMFLFHVESCCSELPQLDGWRVTCTTIRH